MLLNEKQKNVWQTKLIQKMCQIVNIYKDNWDDTH